MDRDKHTKRQIIREAKRHRERERVENNYVSSRLKLDSLDNEDF